MFANVFELYCNYRQVICHAAIKKIILLMYTSTYYKTKPSAMSLCLPECDKLKNNPTNFHIDFL